MFNKWIWTFGRYSMWNGKYVVINGNEIAGRLYVFQKYGRNNIEMSYPYDYGIKNVVEKNHLRLLEEVNV